MKVLYFATYYTKKYVRQSVIRQALRRMQGAEVVECVYNKKSICRYALALWAFLKIPKKEIDVIIVGFRGHEILPVLRLLTRKPIIFDAFISMYDTICFDRKIFSPQSLIGRFVFWYEKILLRLPSHIILDTNSQIEYFHQTFKVPLEKFSRIYVGADTEIFQLQNKMEKNKKFVVFYYGTARPLQGIETILKAAKLLEDHVDIVFKLVGPQKKPYKKEIEQLELKSVEFIDWLPLEELSRQIAGADVCLGGHFSSIPKASRVISGKTFQFLALEKPVIVGRNKANQELLTDKKNCLMVNMDDVKDLKRAILELAADPILREKIAAEGNNTFHMIQKQIIADLRQALNKATQ